MLKNGLSENMRTESKDLSAAKYKNSLPLEGKAKRRRLRRKKGSQPRLAALGSPFQRKGLAWTLPPSYGRRCPKGAEVGWGKRDEKERGRSSQAGNLRKYPSAAVVNDDTQKREIFFVCGQTKDMRSADDGKRRDPHISGLRYFMRELQQKKARGVCQTQAPRAFFNKSPHPPA